MDSYIQTSHGTAVAAHVRTILRSLEDKVKLTPEQAKRVETLAVSYAHYSAADLDTDPQAIWLWGEMLRDAQLELGIELASHDNLIAMIKLARERK
jgi:hypothetical protein